ncbi:MAG: alpha-D-ribose 1-methylphosphonate 5-triphosphate diphosphatase [Pseudomonadota bacterium]
MPEQIISNAKLVLSNEVVHGSLKVSDGQIADISTSQSTSPSALDFEGDYLIPGLIELHTDNLERHIMPRPKSFWPIEAAVLNHDREITAAGITTVFDALCVGYKEGGARNQTSVMEMTEAIGKLSENKSLKAEHKIHWRCEVSGDNLMEELEPLAPSTLTGLISVMDHTPGQRQFVSLDAYYTYYQGKFGLSDAEMETYISDKRAAQERNSVPNRRQVVELAHATNTPLASHDDATMAHVDEAIEDGIVVAEFPTTFEAAEASHNNNLAVLMGAPNVVRGKSHSGNVSARELADARLLDILSSDYVPFSLLYGATILERCCEDISLPEAIKTITHNPARHVGLDDRGEIATGKRADLVRYRMQDAIPNIVEVWSTGQRIA